MWDVYVEPNLPPEETDEEKEKAGARAALAAALTLGQPPEVIAHLMKVADG